MSNRTRRNFLTLRATAAAAYSEVAIEVLSYFAIYAPDTAILVSLGHATPSDSTSIDVPAGGSFELEAGFVGPVHIKSTGADTDCSIVYA